MSASLLLLFLIDSDDAWVDMKKMPDYHQLLRDSISKKTYGKYSLEGYFEEKKFKVDERELALVSYFTISLILALFDVYYYYYLDW